MTYAPRPRYSIRNYVLPPNRGNPKVIPDRIEVLERTDGEPYPIFNMGTRGMSVERIANEIAKRGVPREDAERLANLIE